MTSPPRLPRAAAMTALALALAACGGEPPRWIDLSRGFRPRPVAEQIARWDERSSAPVTIEPEALGIGLVRPLTPDDWRGAGGPGLLETPIPPGALRASGVPPRLVAVGQAYPRASGEVPEIGEYRIEEGAESARLLLQTVPGTLRGPTALLRLTRDDGRRLDVPVRPADWVEGHRPGTFRLPLGGAEARIVLAGDGAPELWTELTRVDEARELAPFEYRLEEERILLRIPPGTRPPAAKLATRLEVGREVNGCWQLRIGRFCGNGLPVWSGAREELVLDLPAASELAFRFVHGARDAAEVRARVLLDGEPLWSHAGPAAEPVEARVALPAGGRTGARLAFEVEGAPGLGAFFTPVVSPRERAEPARPDVVLFLADTFRADGVDPALAPVLARFAEDALRCAHARSPAAWTLPSIGALLTGLAPGQHGATDEDLTLPAGLETLAERLHAAGYRTGAITDGSFFAPIFGLDQGFEWFSERSQPVWDLDATIAEARAFLDADDGRPTFLVVHTYRTHQPYRVGPDEDAREYGAVMARAKREMLAAIGDRLPTPQEGIAAALPHRDELLALYREGVRDLDRGFGLLADDLERRGFFDRGYLLFTSDHGEALGENDDFFHGQHLWEVKLRVPLLLRGPGVVPRTLEPTATLLDVAPTIAQLARLPGAPEWPGTSLLSLAEERPALAFQLSAKKRQMALVDGTRKLITTPDPATLAAGACEEAYELAADPLERINLCEAHDWPAELARRYAERVSALLEPLAATQRASVTPEVRQQLDGIGYGGE